MFNRTALGDVSPALPIDFLIPAESPTAASRSASKVCRLIAPRTRIFLLTRTDLADWLGLTLETISRCLNSFKRQGLIAFKYPEIITVTDEGALRFLASGQPPRDQRTPAPDKTSSQPS